MNLSRYYDWLPSIAVSSKRYYICLSLNPEGWGWGRGRSSIGPFFRIAFLELGNATNNSRYY